MFCKNCGAQVSPDARFCHQCGEKLEPTILRPNPAGSYLKKRQEAQEAKRAARNLFLDRQKYSDFIVEIFRNDDYESQKQEIVGIGIRYPDFPYWFSANEGDVFYEGLPFVQNPSEAERKRAFGKLFTIQSLSDKEAVLLLHLSDGRQMEKTVPYGQEVIIDTLLEVTDMPRKSYSVTILENR